MSGWSRGRSVAALLLVALVGLPAAGCRAGGTRPIEPKWSWSGRLENAARDIAVVAVEGYAYSVPARPGAACLYVRAVHRPAAAPPDRSREVLLTVTCLAGGARRSDEAKLPHDLVAPDGIILNLFTADPLPAAPTACQLEFHDRAWFPRDAPRDPIGVLCAAGGAVREGACPALGP